MIKSQLPNKVKRQLLENKHIHLWINWATFAKWSVDRPSFGRTCTLRTDFTFLIHQHQLINSSFILAIVTHSIDSNMHNFMQHWNMSSILMENVNLVSTLTKITEKVSMHFHRWKLLDRWNFCCNSATTQPINCYIGRKVEIPMP